LRDQEEEFTRRNVKIVVVTFANDFFARSYIEETALCWPLLVDGEREAYRNYGMLSASFWDVWGPKTWWVYLKELLKGQKLHESEGDVFQRGGDVLIDPGGIVRLHHVGKGPADRPTVKAILSRIGS
jgi:AhpC/TSA antioxidant enzyme